MNYSWELVARLVPDDRTWFVVSEEKFSEDIRAWVGDHHWMAIPIRSRAVFLVTDGCGKTITLFKLLWSDIILRDGG